MIIQPKVRGFICTTAHPLGCRKHVEQQIQYVKEQPSFQGPKKVLVIGASTGYGLASRIAATFGGGADTIGVFFEKPGSKNRPGTAGWYNTAAFEAFAKKDGYKAFSINGDAYSNEIKEQTIQCIKKELGYVDCVIYSLASPKRVDPDQGEVYASVIKPIGEPYTNKTVHFHTGDVSELTIDPANEKEIKDTVAVMGGADWKLWMDALNENDVLARGTTTVAYSYVGPEMTHPIYKDGTIGAAKEDLQEAAHKINGVLKEKNGRAFLSVNKALVTQSSSAIPIVPLYISLLYKVMKEKELHEGCIEQMVRLFREELYGHRKPNLDDQGRIRIDDLEMQEDVQEEVLSLWGKVDSQNIDDLSDIKGYREEFFNLFGFLIPSVIYEEDVDPDVRIESIQM